MLRILFYALLAYLCYRSFRRLVGASSPRQGTGGHANGDEAELERDPQCGTYFLRRHGVRAWVNGREVFFCSPECRDLYLKNRGPR